MEKNVIQPIWEPFLEENGDLLNVSILYSDLLWPWSGYMAVIVSVMPNGYNYDGTASGRISVTVTVILFTLFYYSGLLINMSREFKIQN